VGQYRIEHACGRGGFAVVYKAVHQKLHRAAAIKVLHASLAQRDDLVQRFEQEARAITRIRHPNIVDIYDFATLPDGRPYFVIEWLDGQTVSEVLGREGSLPAQGILEVAREIAAGLSAIHGAGVVHRDLKSNNIMMVKVGSKQLIKVLDFGIAKLQDQDLGLSLPGSAIGTPETMSPEQIRGGTVGPASDIYSFGILLYELATAQLPFRGKNDHAIYELQINAPRPVPSKHSRAVGRQFDQIVARCMAVDPQARYQRVEDIIADLERAIEINTTPSNTLAPGSVLDGSYRISGVLGQGGMGTVYEAEHTRLPQRLAIKVMSGNIAEEGFARFRREAQIASSVGHSNIVRVYDFNTLPDGTPYMVMDYLDGHDLATEIGKGVMGPERTLGLARQIASALHAAHNAGVVHRDLKPSNIFLGLREVHGEVLEHITILDFGVSKIQDSKTISTDTAALVGTPQYMAPEQAIGDHDAISGKTDQFALAAVLYEMLSGQAAFPGERIAEIVYKIVHQEPRPLNQIAKLPRAITEAITRALSKRPEDRFANMSDFMEALTGKALQTLKRAKAASKPNSAPRMKRATTPSTVNGRADEPVDPESDTVFAPDSAENVGVSAPGPKWGPLSANTANAKPASIYTPTDEVTRPPKPGEKRKKKGGWALLVGAVLVLAAAAAASVYLGTREQVRSAQAPHDSDEVAAPAVPAPSVVEDTAKAEPPVPPAQVPDEPAAHNDDDAPAKTPNSNSNNTVSKDKKPTPKPASPTENKKPTHKPTSAQAKQDIDAARKALRAGLFDRAIQNSLRAITHTKSSAAYEVLVLAYCGRGDRGLARNHFRRLGRSAKKRVTRICASKYDIDL
jgi:serine/threonine-protein kinase